MDGSPVRSPCASSRAARRRAVLAGFGMPRVWRMPVTSAVGIAVPGGAGAVEAIDWAAVPLGTPPPTHFRRRIPVLAVHDLEIRVGARVLMEDVDFRVSTGDKVGLVGRNGAGKTTLTKTLAGETLPTGGRDRPHRRDRLPAAGPAHRRPRDAGAHAHPRRARPRLARARHARGDAWPWASDDADVAERAMKKYGNLTDRFHGARRVRGRGRGGVDRVATSRCPTASSTSR